MNEPTSSQSDPSGESLSQQWPEVPSFVVMPMQAPNGHAPESLLGKRLAVARQHYQLNIEALARLTKAYDEQEGRGISPATLTRYEAGDSAPGARELRLLCDSLEVSADWLIFGDVGAAGEGKAEQVFLAAMKSLVEHYQEANEHGKRLMGDVVGWHVRMLRAQRISEAKKP